MISSRNADRGTVLSELRCELHPARLLPSLFAGLIIGATMVLWSVTIAALVFDGELEPFVAQGTGYFLFGSMVLALVMALMSSYPGLIAASDEAAAIILSLIAATMASSLLPDAEAETVFTSVVVVVALTTLLSGLVFLALGRFGLGNLVRYIPYPVVGGVIVTMGWLIIVGAFGLMVDQEIEVGSLLLLAEPGALYRWLPGTVFAVTLVIATRKSSHYLVLPVMFALVLGLFYAAAAALGMSMNDLESGGWLLGPFPDQSPWTPIDLGKLYGVDWGLVATQSGSVGSLILLCLLGLLLSATGVEVVVRGEMDLDRELVAAGYANILASLGGGVTGSHSVEDSLLAREMGAPFRLTGIVTAAVCLIALSFGISLLSYLPKTLLGGFILFFGLLLIIEWVYEGWSKLPRADYAVVILCLVVSAGVGYVEGIVVGILAGGSIFIFNYSRVAVIKYALSGTDYHSNVERDARSQRILNQHGDRIYMLGLEGFIFFGTAHKVLDRVRGRLASEDQPELAYLIIDFRNVSDIDSSTVSSFTMMKRLAERDGFSIVLTTITSEIRSYLTQGGVILDPDPLLHIFPDIDRGLEWCEEQLLDAFAPRDGADDVRLYDRLCEQFPDPDVAALLMTYLEQQPVVEGGYLIRQGDQSTDMFFIESGRVAVQLDMGSRGSIRLRSMGAGTVVGEVALYLGIARSASVVAEVRSVVYRLTLDAMERMKAEHPALAATFHAFIVRITAGRLAANNKIIQALHLS